jgi:alpha-tubulin suppressor-like RCC1 family protein
VDTAANVWCWGYGQNGQLGYGDNSNVNHARKVKANASTDFAMAAEVRVGYDSTCARKTDGGVWCWGYDYYWELGIDRAMYQANNYYSYFPTQVPILGTGKATRLAAGPIYTHCALMDDSTVVCWGQNSNGQAGAAPDATHQQVGPTSVTVGSGQGSLTGAVDIASGSSSMCVKTKAPDYAILCWGSYNSNMPYPTPFKDNMQTAVTGIRSPLSAGYYYGTLGYVDPNGLVSSGGYAADLAHNPPCSNLILPDGGIMP